MGENEMYILAKIKMCRACKMSPEMPLIYESGMKWKQRMINKCNELTCDHCGRLNNANHLKVCKGCYSVNYCNKLCQKRAWKTIHRIQCDIFANNSKLI